MKRIVFCPNYDKLIARLIDDDYVHDSNLEEYSGGLYIGEVVAKSPEGTIYWNRKHGFCLFNIENLEYTKPSFEFLQRELFQDTWTRNTYLNFGDIYVLYNLLNTSEYINVIDSIDCENKEQIYTLIYFYILSKNEFNKLFFWYDVSYFKLLYPNGNLGKDAYKEVLPIIGRKENYQLFMHSHMQYVLDLIDEDVTRKSCALYITNIGFRVESEYYLLAIVIELSTGLPIQIFELRDDYIYEDIIANIDEELNKYDLYIDYILYDHDYILHNSKLSKNFKHGIIYNSIDFLSNTIIDYDLFNDICAKYVNDINHENNGVKCDDKFFNILELKAPIGKDTETGELKEIYIYLCRDIEEYLTHGAFSCNFRLNKSSSQKYFFSFLNSFGRFELISKNQIPREKVASIYNKYKILRHSIEYTDSFRSNNLSYAQREYIYGRVILYFIAIFWGVVIKNRLDLSHREYVSIIKKVCYKDNLLNNYIMSIDKSEIFVKQMVVENILNKSIRTFFSELKEQRAYEDDKSLKISNLNEQAKKFYDIFNMSSPFLIERDGLNLKPNYYNTPKILTKSLIFSKCPTIADDEISPKVSAPEPPHGLTKEDLAKLVNLGLIPKDFKLNFTGLQGYV